MVCDSAAGFVAGVSREHTWTAAAPFANAYQEEFDAALFAGLRCVRAVVWLRSWDASPGAGFANDRAWPLRLVGLRNYGATCYSNAVVQLLLHVAPLRRAEDGLPEVCVRRQL